MKQRELPFPNGWGGRRKRSGRPRGTRVSHRTRARFSKPTPVHVTVRVRRHVWNLRSARCYRRIGRCLARACGRLGLRVIEYSVLGNHVHFIVEADDSQALARGMQGLSIRIAKSLNALMSSRGAVFDDHYHSELLTTPTQLANAIAYVLGNAHQHYGTPIIDRFCSIELSDDQRRAFLAAPISWLLVKGWQRAPPRCRAQLADAGWPGA